MLEVIKIFGYHNPDSLFYEQEETIIFLMKLGIFTISSIWPIFTPTGVHPPSYDWNLADTG